MRARVTFFVCFFALCSLRVAADEGVVHERLPNVDSREVSALLDRVAGTTPDPSALSTDEAPMRQQTARADATPPPGRRTMSYSPDRQTNFEGQADYYEVFSPAIAPYKRVSALDTVTLASDGVTPVLSFSSSSARRVVPISGALHETRVRDSFWGRVTLEFSGGTQIPLPSVSPESRVLGFRSTPLLDLRIEKDAADNYYVVSREPLWQDVSVEFLMDAPRDYFGGDLPDGDRSALAQFTTPMPRNVKERALRFASELGLSPRTHYRATLDKLTEHFRDFEESDDPPQNTGDVYLDLARGKRGVCRHRAYAFVVTALALGLPARFVSNEAHAWVEVMTLSRTWRRVDLGGAAQGLRPHQSETTTQYDARMPDPLPKPPAYVAAYAEAQRARQAQQSQQGGTDARTDAARASGMSASASTALPATWRQTTDAAPPAPPSDAPRTSVSLSLDESAQTTFRGREVFVSGRAVDAAGNPAPQLRVEISLLSAQHDRYLPLGVVVTQDDGRFRISVGVPRDVPPGDYRLYVAAPGDRRYAAAHIE